MLKKLLGALGYAIDKRKDFKGSVGAHFSKKNIPAPVYNALFPLATTNAGAGPANGTPRKTSTPAAEPTVEPKEQEEAQQKSKKRKPAEQSEKDTPTNPRARKNLTHMFEKMSESPSTTLKRKEAEMTTEAVVADLLGPDVSLVGSPKKKSKTASIIDEVSINIKLNSGAGADRAFLHAIKSFLDSSGDGTAEKAQGILDSLRN